MLPRAVLAARMHTCVSRVSSSSSMQLAIMRTSSPAVRSSTAAAFDCVGSNSNLASRNAAAAGLAGAASSSSLGGGDAAAPAAAAAGGRSFLQHAVDARHGAEELREFVQSKAKWLSALRSSMGAPEDLSYALSELRAFRWRRRFYKLGVAFVLPVCVIGAASLYNIVLTYGLAALVFGCIENEQQALRRIRASVAKERIRRANKLELDIQELMNK